MTRSQINLQDFKEELPETCKTLESYDDSTLQSVVYLKDAIAALGDQTPAAELVQLGITVSLMNLLEIDSPELKYNCIWAITLIATFEELFAVHLIEQGYLVSLLHLIDEPPLKGLCVWSLGSIAAVSSVCADAITGYSKLLFCIANSLTEGNQSAKWAIFCLSELCKNSTRSLDHFNQSLSAIGTLLQSGDVGIVKNSMEVLVYGCNHFTAIDLSVVSAIVDVGRLKNSESYIKDVLKCCSLLIAKDTLYAKLLVNEGLLHMLLYCLINKKYAEARFEVFVVIEKLSISAETIQPIFDANLLPPLIHALIMENHRTRSVIVLTLYNFMRNATDATQVRFLHSQGMVKPLISVIDSQDPFLIELVLQIVNELLCYGRGTFNEFLVEMTETNFHSTLTDLQYNDNAAISLRASTILDDFFCEE